MRHLFLILVLLFHSGPAAACPPVWPSATFLQLYDDSPEIDEGRLATWRSIGVEELILQWSAYGPPDSGAYPLVESGRLERLLDAAEQVGLRVRLGLRYDPGFWGIHDERDHHAEGTEEGDRALPLARYFSDRLADLRGLLKALTPLANHSAFAGWYISDEIDDRNWNNPRRRLRLAEYLGQTAGLLHSVTPGASLAISGFSDARLPPREWAELWAQLLPGAGIDLLLFQDGIGAGKLEMEELGYYLPRLAQELQEVDRDLSVVVEIFAQKDAGGGYRPATLQRIVRQLQWSGLGTLPPASFAVPHYADPAAGTAAAALATELATLRQRCASDLGLDAQQEN